MQRTRLGVLTPSSNTVLEPMTSELLAGLEDVSAHFGRFSVKEISLTDDALGQFELQPFIDASRLLADAKVQSITWSGTSAGWLGFAADQQLCAQITQDTGIAATTSVLALNEILAKTQTKTFGLVTPYLDEVQAAIIANYAAAGFECVAERHLRDRGNFSFSEVGETVIADMVRQVAKAQPQAICIFCTNLRGAKMVADLEQEVGIPIYDTVATGVWKGMQLAGADPKRIAGWGRLFAELE